MNSIEVLSVLKDEVSKNEALELLNSDDEFVQYDAIKFLVNDGAKDALNRIVNVMRTSSLSENIAAEIPYLISFEELLEQDFDTAVLVLCNIVKQLSLMLKFILE